MAILAIFSSTLLSYLILFAILLAATDGLPVSFGAVKVSDRFLIGGRNLVPVSDGLLKFTPLASGPVAMAPDAGVLRVLAAKRTRRPDVLNKFRHYRGGWDITNRHYWASVGFTGAAGFILALIWFLSFAFALAVFHCRDWRMTMKEKASEKSKQWFYLLFLLLFSCTASGMIYALIHIWVFVNIWPLLIFLVQGVVLLKHKDNLSQFCPTFMSRHFFCCDIRLIFAAYSSSHKLLMGMIYALIHIWVFVNIWPLLIFLVQGVVLLKHKDNLSQFCPTFMSRHFFCCDIRLIFAAYSSSHKLLMIGCILLCVAQDEFYNEASNTFTFVVQQSNFIVEILRNVTDYLSLAKTISVDEFYISSGAQNEINKLDVDLRRAAYIISEKTTENLDMIRRAMNYVRDVLILVAVIMLLLALLGFVLSILGHKRAIYVLTTAGWLLVAVTLFLFGVFVVLKSTVGDTCTAMNEWAHYPRTESALSNILPCVDPKTTNRTLYQSKQVVLQLVSVVNSVIRSTADSNRSPSQSSNHFNQSGPVMPLLCSPYDSKLELRNCQPHEVSFRNASLVWKDYICAVSESGSCTGFGRITPNVYLQLVVAVNASYALEHYTPLLLNLQDCKFVRESFTTITSDYCNYLERDLSMVNTGLILISIGIILCLFFWILYANRRQQQVPVTLSEPLQMEQSAI